MPRSLGERRAALERPAPAHRAAQAAARHGARAVAAAAADAAAPAAAVARGADCPEVKAVLFDMVRAAGSS